MNWCYILGTCTNFVFDGDMPNVIGKVVHGMLELVSVWRQYMFLGDVMVDIEVVVDEKDGGRKVTNSPISGGRLKSAKSGIRFHFSHSDNSIFRLNSRVRCASGNVF